jgi:hypothetical protein
MKTFIQILMAVLALGVSSPQPVCAAGASEAGKVCCCTGSPVCKCHPDKPCKQSCTLVKVQAFDKQISARLALMPGSEATLLFFWAVPTKIKYPVVAPIVSRRDTNASPPFGGAPPQAMLRLWLI